LYRASGQEREHISPLAVAEGSIHSQQRNVMRRAPGPRTCVGRGARSAPSVRELAVGSRLRCRELRKPSSKRP
jgi:hypothetical protein